MNKLIGLALFAAAFVAGATFFGWQGVILAFSGVILYLLLQFTQLMRVMRTANEAPMGHVSSAIMLQSRLHAGMKLIDLIKLCKSLGVKVADDTYRWTDAGGDAVDVVLHKSVVVRWSLVRATASDAPAAPAPDAAA